MKKRFLSVLLSLCMMMTLLPTAALAAITADTSWYTGHEGDTGYTLNTAEELAGLAVLVNAGNDFGGKTVSLAANIDLKGEAWTPIGTEEYGFSGIFDGYGYTVSGLYINNSENYQALFGCATYSANGTAAVIRNLGIFGSVTAGGNAAGIVGYLSGGAKVVNCYSQVAVTATGGNAGGIAAFCSSAIIENCYNAGSVSADGGHAGGISGHVDGLSSAKNNYSLDAAVSAAADIGGTLSAGSTYYAGKLIGYHELGRADISGSKTFAGGGAETLLADLTAWVNAKQSADYYIWKIVDSYPVHNAPYDGTTYPVTVTLKRNGEEWTGHGKSITLVSGGAALSGMVATNGAYNIYADGADTGVSVTVDGAAAEAEVNYYTISGAVTGEDGIAVSGRTVNLFAEDDADFANAIGSGTVQDDGTYTISAPVLPGNYVARISALLGSYAATAANVTVTDSTVTNANLTLSAPTLSQIRVNSTTHKTAYQVGDPLSVDALTILTVYTDGSTATVPVTADMVSGFQSDAAHAGKQTLTITYGGKTCTYPIEVVVTPYMGTQASAPTLSGRTETSVTLTPQSIPGETVEYAKSDSAAVPDSGWQTDTSFTGLSSGAYYYFFARVKATATHGIGTAASAQIRTVQGTFPEKLDIASGNIVVDPGTTTGTIKVTHGAVYDNLPATTEITVSGTTSAYSITANADCNITLDGVDITNEVYGYAPLYIASGTVSLTLQGINTVVSTGSKSKGAGIYVDSTATLIITKKSTGSLSAKGPDGNGGEGAGIGGVYINNKKKSGTIIIEGGVVSATAYCNAAGIGGAGDSYGAGSCGSVTITGGTVIATGGSWRGAGIGGGMGGSGGTVVITGGSVKATGFGGAAAIGAGVGNYLNPGTLKNDSGTDVHLATFTVPNDATGGEDVSSMTFTSGGKAYDYNMAGAKSILDGGAGKVYVYLPAGEVTATYGGKNYKTTVKADGTAVFAEYTQQTLTATVSMDGYTYGDTPSTPSVSGNTSGGAVTYYYSTTNSNTGGTEWKNMTGTTLNAGDYYLYAVIAAAGDYKACTTAAVKFTVAKAELRLDRVSVTGKIYDGTTTCEGSLTLSGAVNGEKPAATGTFAWTSKDAGTDTFNVTDIKLAGVWGDNYTLSAASRSDQKFGTAKISAKTINIPAQILVYGNLNSLTKTDHPTGVGDETVSLTYTAYSKDAGTYTYSAAAKPGCYILSISSANYTPGSADTLTISPMPLAVPDKTVTYNGEKVFTTDITGANKEKVTLTYTAGSSGAGEYTYNAQSGNSYSASLPTGTNNYKLADNGHGTLTISPLAAALTWDYTTASTYDGTAKTVTASVSNKVGTDTFALTYSDNSKTDAGDYTATVTALGNASYTMTGATGISQEWSIAPAALTVSLFTFTPGSALTYDGSAKPAAVTAKADGNYAAPTGTVTVYYEKQNASGYDTRTTTVPTDAGTYRVSVDVAAKGNYQKADNLTDSAWTFTIAKAAITDHTVTQSGTLTYNGEAQTAAVSKAPTTVGGQTASYTYCATKTGTYSAAVPAFTTAGTHTVYYKVTAPNHEDASGSFTVTIGALALSSATVTVSPDTIVYSGTAWEPTVTVKVGDKTIPAADYEVSYENNTAAGTVTVTVTAKTDNCTGENSVDKSITAAELNASLFAFTPNSSLTFDTTEKAAAVTARANGNYAAPTGAVTVYYELKTGESTYAARTAAAPKDAGTYRVSVDVAAKENYQAITNLTADGWTFTVAKAPISFTVTDTSYTYDAAAHKATVAQTSSESTKIAADKVTITYKLPDDNSGTAYKTNVGTYDIIVTLSDDNFCFAGEAEETIRNHTLTDKLTITQNTVTALWKNATAVYDGTVKSPEFALVGLQEGDSAVTVQLTESKTNAGTYIVTAQLTGYKAANYTLTNPTGTFIIQKAPVSFTLSGNSVKKGDSINVIATPSINGAGATLSYWQNGKQVATPTDVGSYDIYAAIADGNYRHAGSTDGTAQKIGVLTIYETAAPATYTVSFDANGGTGSTADMSAVQAGTVRVLPVNGFTSTGKTFNGWQYGGKTYQPGERFTQPASNVTLKALWNENAYSIGGVVQEGDPAASAASVVVTLMQGSHQIGQTVTDTDGQYSFTDVIPGIYNLVASKNGVTQTILVAVTDKAITDQTITMPIGNLSSVVEVKAGSPAIVVGNLETAFTAEDKADAQTQTVELRLTAEAKAADNTNEARQEIERKAGSVGLYLDLTLTKTVDGVATALDSSPVLLTAVIPLPAELQGKDSYTVYRYHGAEVQTLTTSANADGEKIEISKDKASLTIYAKNFSLYALKGITYSGSSGCTLTFHVNGGIAIASVYKSFGAAVDLSAYTPTREGYTFAGWYSDSALTKAVTSVKLTSNTTVYAKWIVQNTNLFTDIKDDAYYYNAVLWAVEKGITSGTSATTFEPNVICTRAQAVTFLWRAAGSPEATATVNPFTDVKANTYYYKAVLWAVEKGITKGTSDTTFTPDALVTRGQTATFLWRAAEMPAATTVSTFTDVPSDAYYAAAVLWAAEKGITSGTSETTFSPANPCSRAQIVTFLHRYLGK